MKFGKECSENYLGIMAHDILRTARKLYADELYDEAIPILREAVSVEPDNVEAWRFLAFSLLAVAASREAAGAIVQGLQLSPSDPWLIYGYGVAMVEDGDFETAIQSFTVALQHQPNHRLARAALVDCLVHKSRELLAQYRYEAGRELLEQAVIIDPESEVPYLHLAKHCLESSHHTLAQQWITRGLEACPESVELIQLAAKNGFIHPPAITNQTAQATSVPEVFAKKAFPTPA